MIFSAIRKRLSRWKWFALFSFRWRMLQRIASCISGDVSRRDCILIIPCDPTSVVGSRGDQAMILAVYQTAHEKYPDLPIDILVASHDTDEALRDMNLNPVVQWPPLLGDWFEAHIAHYRAVYILGADVTDGVYGWSTSMNLLAMYDLFSRVGTETCYLGFSFSTRPDPVMKHVFRHLKKNLPLLVRDPVSRDRVESFTSHRPVRLVADAAFCLKPDVSLRIQKDCTWCEGQHVQGRRILAVNIHPMFNDVGGDLERWRMCFIQTLLELLAHDANLSLLFLPHDDRPNISDLLLLKEIYEGLPREYASRLHFVETVYRADEIKALVGCCDALLAGRMHLSIAALGQGIPVFALVYQDKFEGLWQHFGLDSETLCDPREFLRSQSDVQKAILSFLDQLPVLREQIQNQLPNVLELSRSQFA